MINPLSSLASEVAEEDLPGYISSGSSSTHNSDSKSTSDGEDDDEMLCDAHHHVPRVHQIRLMSTTPPLVHWDEVITPEFKLRQIRQYEEYVARRIECSVASGMPLTPSVSHVNEKVRKAHTTLAINGITATQAMRMMKEKNLRRRVRDERTSVIANYGPIRVHDARLRVAKDDHNRLANQQAEEKRIHRKEVENEVIYMKRWLSSVRRILRVSLTELRVAEVHSGQPTYENQVKPFTAGNSWVKTDRRRSFSSSALMGQRYALHREMFAKHRKSFTEFNEARERKDIPLPEIFRFLWYPPFLLPFDYSYDIVKEALEFVAEERRRREGQKQLSLEADGVEIVDDGEEMDIDEGETIENNELIVGDNVHDKLMSQTSMCPKKSQPSK